MKQTAVPLPATGEQTGVTACPHGSTPWLPRVTEPSERPGTHSAPPQSPGRPGQGNRITDAPSSEGALGCRQLHHRRRAGRRADSPGAQQITAAQPYPQRRCRRAVHYPNTNQVAEALVRVWPAASPPRATGPHRIFASSKAVHQQRQAVSARHAPGLAPAPYHRQIRQGMARIKAPCSSHKPIARAEAR